MTEFAADTLVYIRPFARQQQGSEVVVGLPETGVFLAVPPEAVELLDVLASGKTVGQAQDFHCQRYGEIPDLPEFLGFLEKRGFVYAVNSSSALPLDHGRSNFLPPSPRYHFQSIRRELAERIFSRPVLSACRLLIAVALAAIALEPAILPGRRALFFQEHRSLYSLSLMVIGSLAVFLHEMGHLLAARALGINSRLSIGHRLWIVVAETDLTGLWSVPKQKRYLPLLAGPLVDLVSASTLVLILFAQAKGWYKPGAVAARLLPAVLFGYLMRLLWQFFFFVRTDVYYLIATFFDCKNLLKDTEGFLRNLVSRVLPGLNHVDQSSIPTAEMRVIRGYSVVWLVGRGIAFGTLFMVTLPLSLQYFRAVRSTLSAGAQGMRYEVIDSIVFTVLSLTPLALGLGLWLRSLARRWMKANAKT